MSLPATATDSFYRRRGKRLLDLCLALIAAPLIALPLALAAAAVRCSLGAPVLLRQQRPGLGARPFTLLKLRTMRDLRDEQGRLLPDEARLTRLGRFLRRTSLDELPEAWNVLRGEMSLVGPRPLLMEYLELYTSEQRRRHDVRPGITGWAQVHGRNAATWPEKFRYDLDYVNGVRLDLDLRILTRTAWQVARGEGVSFAGHATSPKFQGERDVP
ncbi:MAG: sugar transferase [Thermoanaerobaculia bacterium]